MQDIDPVERWTNWDDVAATQWEILGPIEVDEAWHSRLVGALDVSPSAADRLDGVIHPGVLALQLLTRLQRHFVIPRPAADGPVATVQSRQLTKFLQPIPNDASLQATGRVVEKRMDDHGAAVVMEAKVSDSSGAELLHHTQTVRYVAMSKVLAK